MLRQQTWGREKANWEQPGLLKPTPTDTPPSTRSHFQQARPQLLQGHTFWSFLNNPVNSQAFKHEPMRLILIQTTTPYFTFFKGRTQMADVSNMESVPHQKKGIPVIICSSPLWTKDRPPRHCATQVRDVNDNLLQEWWQRSSEITSGKIIYFFTNADKGAWQLLKWTVKGETHHWWIIGLGRNGELHSRGASKWWWESHCALQNIMGKFCA